jgi:aryl-alcohol dehydrogenase-like predicted oxidoreductase
MKISRRELLKLSATAGAAMTLSPQSLFAQSRPLILKQIPSSGEGIPPIGIGTNRYGVGATEAERAPLRATLKKFAELGGKLIDTAPVYGTSETVLGDLIAELGVRDQLFLATKSDMRGSVSGAASYQASLDRLKTDKVELMQVHNMVNAASELAVMREWQQAGKIKYIGVTTSSVNQFADLEKLMASEKLDFVQLNYSLDDREAEKKLLPLALDQGIAVIVNLPFGRGSLFRKTGDKPLPDWAAEFDCETWGQFFLKYIVSHPAITCAIPGTRAEHHAVDNFGAALGRLPDAGLRKRQKAFFDSMA